MAFEQNSDGLDTNYGIKPKAQGGSVGTNGPYNELVVTLDYNDGMGLVADGSVMLGKSVSGAALIPAGALIRSATLIVEEAFTSAGAATLDIGLLKEDRTTIDLDGIDAAIAITVIDAIGDEVACNGALVNTITAFNSYVSAEVNTADFTAGKARLVIQYLVL